jgi:hypothetical protein
MIPEGLALNFREDEVYKRDGKRHAPENQVKLHVAAAGSLRPGGYYWREQVNTQQHIHEPEMPYIGAEIDEYLGDVDQLGH